MIDLHLRLCTQDGIERPQPMYITLATQPRFTKRYSELLSAAGEGKGLSQVRTYSSVDEYQPSVHDNQSQAVQGSPDASGYSPDNNQASVQSDYRADEGEFDQQAEEQHLEVKTTLEEVSTVVLEAETKDDFIVIENGTQNGNKEDRAPEFDLTDAHSERATVQSSPSHEEDEADVVASLTEEQYEVLPTKITIEEVADDNVDDTQLPEEVYEPEGSVLTESRSVTEVTTETVQDEEELLEYEEEDETGYVVRSEGSPQQEPESESTLHESHVPSPGSTSNEAEGKPILTHINSQVGALGTTLVFFLQRMI